LRPFYFTRPRGEASKRGRRNQGAKRATLINSAGSGDFALKDKKEKDEGRQLLIKEGGTGGLKKKEEADPEPMRVKSCSGGAADS